MANLDDEVIEEFYKLGKEIRGLYEEKYIKSLRGILHEEASKYLHENKDDEHEVKWKSDEEIKNFAYNLWDKAADHVAQNYLKLTEDQISSLRDKEDPDFPERSQFDVFMANYLGIDKKSFFEKLKQNPTLGVDNLLEYIDPLHQGHIDTRQQNKITYKLQNMDDAENLLEYTKMLKKHNPKTVKLRIPDNIRDMQQVASLYTKALGMLPEGYHPKKEDTYAKK